MKSALFITLLMASLSASAKSVESGTSDAAEALAKDYMATMFILVGPPKVDGDQALVTARVFGQQCQLNMVRIGKEAGNSYGWQIFGQICGPIPSAESGKWITDEQGKPQYVQP
jgi:hypothetical protein